MSNRTQAARTKAEEPQPPAIPAPAGLGFPQPVYNPFLPNERFRPTGRGGWVPFVAGRFVAQDEAQLEAALACVAYHKQGGYDPRAFVGDDAKEWSCKEANCGFRTRNAAARDAHETIAHR